MTQPVDHLVWLASGGSEGFVALPEWRGEMTRAGIRCGWCHGVRPDAVDRLENIVISDPPPRIVAGHASGLWGGQIVREDLVALIDANRLARFARSVAVINDAGLHVKDFHYYIERVPRAEWRGTRESKIGLCKECGRLLYWPVPAPYMLRRYWGDEERATLICGEVVCTPRFANTIAGMEEFSTLVATNRDIRETAADGLPEDFHEMVAEIGRRGWVR